MVTAYAKDMSMNPGMDVTFTLKATKDRKKINSCMFFLGVWLVQP